MDASGLSDLDDGSMAGTYMEDITAYFRAMAEDWNVKLIAGSIISFLANWFGEDWWMVETLFLLIFADCALGLFSAIRFEGHLNGRRLHDGVIKFLAYAISIVFVWLVQEIARHSLGFTLPILAVFAAYQSLTEIKSIARHLERNGLKMPDLFHRVTSGVEDKVEEKLDEVLPESKDDKHEAD